MIGRIKDCTELGVINVSSLMIIWQQEFCYLWKKKTTNYVVAEEVEMIIYRHKITTDI